MIAKDYVYLIIYFLTLFILAPLLGTLMFKIFTKPKDLIFESKLYKLLGLNMKGQTAREYLNSLLSFNFVGLLLFFSIVYFFKGAETPMSWHLAFNTAVSFVTNTNWQAYSGEASLTPLMQMLSCTVQNFLSAATGIAVLLAFARGLKNRKNEDLGNFYRDMTRSVFYVLLPLSLILTLSLTATGVVQTLDSKVKIETLDGEIQTIPLGPVASQVAIKQLGTNGGGYFGVNSAHPLENPSPISNFLELLAILLLPVSLIFTFGKMIEQKKHGFMIFSVMSILLFMGLGLSLYSEHQAHPENLSLSEFKEGKETRFSKTESVLWAVTTTAASNGSVNSMHSSFSPLTGFVTLFNIVLGEIIFGGVGAGLYGMLIFILLTVFLSGLMVGRTPEYLQKKIDSFDMKLVITALILPSCTILLGAAVSLWSPMGLESRLHLGPHGLSEILYAWSSAAGNNGSAFAGLNANTVFYNLLLGFAMLIGRFGVIIPCLLIAGNFSKKKIMQDSPGQMKTDNATFAFVLIAIILVVGALSFFPALLLGPITEHLLMLKNISF